MEKLIERGNQLAVREQQRMESAAKLALNEAVPAHLSVTEDGDDLVIIGPGLSDHISMNSDLRDIAFLMRGLR